MEIKKCKRCHRPMVGLKKITDISDICSNCLTIEEKKYSESNELKNELRKKFGL